MENVLVISGNPEAAKTLCEFIKASFGCSVRAIETAYQAKNIFESDSQFELAVINAPLADESGMELAQYIIDNTSVNCILVMKTENAEKLRERAENSGIIIVGKPFNKTVVYQIMRTVDIAARRSMKLYDETVRLERKIEEIKTVDKAKFMLMQYRDMTEEQAHIFLEQYAMNKRKKKVIAASEIIDKMSEQYL